MDRPVPRLRAAALRVAGLVAGLWALAVVLVAALLVADAVSLLHPGPLSAVPLLVTAALAVGAVRARPALRPVDEPPVGLRVLPAEEPVLWAALTHLAESAGTPPPDETWLTLRPEVSVTQLKGRRRLELGLPLLLGLSVTELHAVVGHELGHFGTRHTRLSPAVHRGSRTVARLVGSTQERRLLGAAVRAFAALYVGTAGPVNEQQELDADLLGARAGGAAAMISALRKAPWIDDCWDAFLETYVEPALGLGLVPQGMLAGFSTLLTQPDWQARLGATDTAAAGEPDPYDSHPPLFQRLRALEALAPGSPGDSPPAWTLLSDGAALDRRVEPLVATRGQASTPWAAAGAAVGDQRARRRAGALVAVLQRDHPGAPATLSTAVAVARSGAGTSLGQALLGAPDQPGERREAAAARALVDALGTLVACSYVSRGQARWQPSLTGRPFQLVTGDGQQVLLERAAEQLVTDPTPPDVLLTAWALDPASTVTAMPQAVLDPTQWLASLIGLGAGLQTVDLVVRRDGLLVVRSSRRRRRPARLQRLSTTSTEELLAEDPRNRWIRPEQVARARLRGNGVAALLQKEWRLVLRLRTGKRRTFVVRDRETAQVLHATLPEVLGRSFGP